MIKLTIEITYNGKSFESIEDAMLAAVINGMKKIMEKKMQPFASEIAEHGGKVIYNITGDSFENLKGSISVKGDVPKEITERIINSLHE
jgi:hypothetical protein